MEQGVQTALNGVKMEIEDATYPLVKGTVTTGDAKVRAFTPLQIGFLPSFCPAAFLVRLQGCITRRLCLCVPRSSVSTRERGKQNQRAHTRKSARCRAARPAPRQGRQTAAHPSCADACGEVLCRVAFVMSSSE